ncbi:hypothetical protein BLA24064_03026 [Burkholderia latens]|nr:hypothetical protein BLA24064_03026 [Burkholderia latens]
MSAVLACLKHGPAISQQQAVVEIEKALELYEAEAAFDKSAAGQSSASRKVATLEPLLETAAKLRDGLMNVPAQLRMELMKADGSLISDTEVMHICDALQIAINRYKGAVGTGRHPVSSALQRTVFALLCIFTDRYAGLADEREADERDFVHRALAAAGIPHVDPDTHSADFSDLLKMARNS